MDALGPDADPLARLRAAIAAHLRFVLAEDAYASANLRILGQVPEPIRERHLRRQRAYGAFWRDAVPAMRRTPAPSAPTSTCRWSRMLALGALNWSVEWYREGRRTPSEVASHAATMILDGIAVASGRYTGVEARHTPARRQVVKGIREAAMQRMNELGFYTLAGAARSRRASSSTRCSSGEALGFGSAFISERFNVKEAATLSGAAGAVSTEIGIATAATNHNTRHPMVTAAFAMTMHKLTGGRFSLGLGRGIGAVFDAYGLPPHQDRRDRGLRRPDAPALARRGRARPRRPGGPLPAPRPSVRNTTSTSR